MLTILFMLWSLIRNITKSVTGRVTPPRSLSPEEGGFVRNNIGEYSAASSLKMGPDDYPTTSAGIYNGKGFPVFIFWNLQFTLRIQSTKLIKHSFFSDAIIKLLSFNFNNS